MSDIRPLDSYSSADIPEDWREAIKRRTQAFEEAAKAAGFTVDVQWLPNPGNSEDKWQNEAFRFEATVRNNGKVVLVTPYWAGIGHAVYGQTGREKEIPQYGPERANLVVIHDAIMEAVRTAKPVAHPFQMPFNAGRGIRPKMPTAADILGSLCSNDPNDSTFEEWCADLGMDTDSRKAEKTYRLVVDNTLRLRRACGAEAWQQLCELAREL